MKITFCLITLNEEENLARCLQSFSGLADEVVVLDSGSKDGTERIAREFGVRWHTQEWLGYVKQKNAVLALAAHEWVFSIDADEELSPELRAEVRALKASAIPEATSGYSVPRCVLYEGRWIRHGDWYPDRLVRLFRKERAKFAGGKVHERLEIDGEVTALAGDLYHHSFKNPEDHWARCEKYARLWAETQHEQGRSAGPLSPHSHAAFRWFRGYFLKAGFMDGAHGWRIATFCAREAYLKYKLLREMNSR